MQRYKKYKCLNRDFDKIFRIHKINPANLENLVGIVVQDKETNRFRSTETERTSTIGHKNKH